VVYLYGSLARKENVSKTMVLLHEFDDNVAVVARTVASITTGIVHFLPIRPRLMALYKCALID